MLCYVTFRYPLYFISHVLVRVLLNYAVSLNYLPHTGRTNIKPTNSEEVRTKEEHTRALHHCATPLPCALLITRTHRRRQHYHITSYVKVPTTIALICLYVNYPNVTAEISLLTDLIHHPPHDSHPI